MASQENNIIEKPLKWETLSSKTKAERKTLINQRVRFFLQVNPSYPEVSKTCVQAIEEKRNKRQVGFTEEEIEGVEILGDPREKLGRIFPVDKTELALQARKEKARYFSENENEGLMNELDSEKTMKKFREEKQRRYGEIVGQVVKFSTWRLETEQALFEESGLCNKLKALIEEFFKFIPQVDKIVALGGGALNPGAPYWDITQDTTAPGRAQRIQHVSLLIFKKSLAKLNSGTQVLVYIQDPAYLDIDEKVAERKSMTVCKCGPHEQEGWAHIDESTFLVDFQTSFPIHQLVFEIARPAAIFTFIPITEERFTPNVAFSAVVEKNDVKVGIPGVGCSDYRFEDFKNDYDHYQVDLTDLEVGSKGDLEMRTDGYSGKTYIGQQPMLYIRKPHVVSKEL